LGHPSGRATRPFDARRRALGFVVGASRMSRNVEASTSGPEQAQRPPAAAGAARSARRVLEGQAVWVLAEETSLARPLAVELGGLGATVLVAGPNERKVGEIIGEIAYQGGAARHLCRELSTDWAATLEACGASLGGERSSAPSVLVVALTAAASQSPSLVQLLEAELATFTSRLAPGGALLVAVVGPVADAELAALAAWARTAARQAARSDGRHLVNVLVLHGREGDADGAARIGTALCTPRLGSLSGQVVVVATK
jgi:hypothetical protein